MEEGIAVDMYLSEEVACRVGEVTGELGESGVSIGKPAGAEDDHPRCLFLG